MNNTSITNQCQLFSSISWSRGAKTGEHLCSKSVSEDSKSSVKAVFIRLLRSYSLPLIQRDSSGGASAASQLPCFHLWTLSRLLTPPKKNIQCKECWWGSAAVCLISFLLLSIPPEKLYFGTTENRLCLSLVRYTACVRTIMIQLIFQSLAYR